MDKINEILQYNEKESKLFIHNEIFNDLKHNLNRSNHIPFAYSYYYLICWLYRYAKYGQLTIDNKSIKKILGYSPTYPEIDYIIKKNGVLDVIGYTITAKDYPISWTFDNNCLDFFMLRDCDEETQKLVKGTKSRKYTVKFPPKAFHRTQESEEGNHLDGTFYDVSNTHLIPFEVFMFCMSKKDIGCTGFYLWSYLKMQNQLFEGGYDISLDDLSNEVSIPRSTMCKYLNTLRAYSMINCYHNQQFFCIALKEEDRKSNTYMTNDYELFSDKPIDFKRIKVVKVNEYMKLKSDESVIETSIAEFL